MRLPGPHVGMNGRCSVIRLNPETPMVLSADGRCLSPPVEARNFAATAVQSSSIKGSDHSIRSSTSGDLRTWTTGPSGVLVSLQTRSGKPSFRKLSSSSRSKKTGYCCLLGSPRCAEGWPAIVWVNTLPERVVALAEVPALLPVAVGRSKPHTPGQRPQRGSPLR